MPKSNWGNAKVMANQGSAPKVTEMMFAIINDPFSQCFFLSSLYDKKEKELKAKKPLYFTQSDHATARLRVELVLCEMYLHIKIVQRNGLIEMKNHAS